MLPEGTSYEEVRARFRWDIPERYNIGAETAGPSGSRAGRRSCSPRPVRQGRQL